MTLTRRQLLTAVGGGAGAALTVATAQHLADPVPRAGAFDGVAPLRAAMHVHGSWSEGRGSWAAQLAQAAAAQVDLLFLTDHDNRALAYGYLTSLDGAAWQYRTSGTARERDLHTPPGGALRIAVESDQPADAATGALVVEPETCAKNYLRTSICGLVLRPTFATVLLPAGAVFEIQIELSLHPGSGERPEGQLVLVYRFGAAATPTHLLEQGGLVGVVALPAPVAGQAPELLPADDVATLWPQVWAADNCLYGMAFSATSPGAGARVEVVLSGLAIERSRNILPTVVEDQQAMLAAYADLYPSVSTRLSTEIGRSPTHFNVFGIPPVYPDYALDTETVHHAFHHDLVDDIHALGGAVSLNHPLGFQSTAPVSAAEQVRIRQQVYTRLANQGAYGIDVLEVAYVARGKCNLQTHADLWDTFSRNGFYLTGNGVSDDHGGKNWLGLGNGFITGLWGSSTQEGVVAALRAGRAFMAHPGKWPGGALDLLVDDAVPMGAVAQTTTTSHRLRIFASGLVGGFVVEVVRGPVDRSGALNPGTVTAASLPAASFVDGMATVKITSSTSRFFRVQVRNRRGVVVGLSNPVWLLREDPPGGIPPSRRA